MTTTLSKLCTRVLSQELQQTYRVWHNILKFQGKPQQYSTSVRHLVNWTINNINITLGSIPFDDIIICKAVFRAAAWYKVKYHMTINVKQEMGVWVLDLIKGLQSQTGAHIKFVSNCAYLRINWKYFLFFQCVWFIPKASWVVRT